MQNHNLNKLTMSSLKHTSAPWNNGLHDGQVLDNGNQPVCNCYSAFRTPQEIKANAKLIAAAPELLDALKQSVELIKRMQDYIHERNPVQPPSSDLHLFSPSFTKAIDAIRKAEL